MSLAARPSNIGTRFHNYLYAELGLDFVYKAFTTPDLRAAVAGIRALGIRGCGVSMPYKEECIDYVDELDASAAAIRSVNTIVNTDGHLKCYNTDYVAVATLLAASQVDAADTVSVLGSGGMAKAVVAAARDAGIGSGTVVARNEQTGRALAEQYGFAWAPALGTARPSVIVNATPVGMAGGDAADQLAADEDTVAAARVVFDVVAVPDETPLVRTARVHGKQVVTGGQVIGLQALEQFVLYTGVRPTEEQARRASAYSRR